MNKEATTQGWVARNFNGKILFFNGERPPQRPEKWSSLPKQWQGTATPVNGIPLIPKGSFPDLTWEDEPKKVTIKITIDE